MLWARVHRPPTTLTPVTQHPRDIALRIIHRLRDGGHIAYLAGGCVRDELLRMTPKDYDIATDATPARVGELFRRAREVGKAFGVMLVHDGGITVEVTTFRREGGYTDRRRPDHVEFADARADAQRRDFTINALYIDPVDIDASPAADASAPRVRVAHVRGAVIDHVGGLADLERRIIRAVGDPDARLREDDLRCLRAVRFAARLGFEIEAATEAAVRRHAGDLVGISRERIGDELRMMLAHPTRSAAAERLESLALDGPTLAEAPRARAWPSRPPLATLAAVPAEAGFPLAAAAWMIDRLGVPDSPHPPTSRVAAEAPAMIARWRASLCLSNEERDEITAVLRMLVVLERDWETLGMAGRKRAAASRSFGGAIVLLAAREPALARRLGEDVGSLALTPGGLAPAPWVTGDNLVAHGVPPGPGFGKWLDDVYDAQLEGRVANPGEALELAITLWRAHKS